MEVLVLLDFEGQLSDELKVKAGDIIHKVQPGPEEGWLQGELDGRTGLFPQHFVQEIPVCLRADGTQRYPRSIRNIHAEHMLATSKQRWCRVTFPYIPAKDDELELCSGELVQILKEIEDGWWLGKKNGQIGAFPSNFVQELDSIPSEMNFADRRIGAAKQRPKMTEETFLINELDLPENAPEKPLPQIQPVANVPVPPTCSPAPSAAGDAPQYCRVMFDYEPAHDDELPLKKGDLVRLLNKVSVDMGWWEGECCGKKGLFPDNFVMLLTHVEPGFKTKVPIRSKTSATTPGKKVSPVSKVEAKHPAEGKDSKELKKMGTPKSTPLPSKKPAPPPPVPVKNKPQSFIPHKSSNIPVAGTATPAGKGKGKETEANTFDSISTPSAKLSHPTANRPKMPGKRPPSQLISGVLHTSGFSDLLNSAEKAKSPEQGKAPPSLLREESSASACETLRTEEQPTSLEELKTELQSLRTFMDLMSTQYWREIEGLKSELHSEKSQRAALQAEIEQLKLAMSSPESLGHICKNLTLGNGETELVGLSAPQHTTNSVPSTKAC